MKITPVAFAAVLLSLSGPAFARCSAQVVSTVHAMEDMNTVMQRGSRFGPPTQLDIDPSTGTAFICAHGTFCYDSEGIELKGCKIIPVPPNGRIPGDDQIIFDIR